MRRLLCLLLLPALLLAGCSGRQRVPSFVDGALRRQRLAVNGEGSYTLQHPARAADDKQAFFLRVPAGAAVSELRVLDPMGRVLASRTLTSAPVPLTLLVPLPRGALVGGFTLKPPAGDAVREAGITDALAGFERGDGELRVGSGVRRLELGSGYAEVELDAEAFRAAREWGRWRVELEYESFGPASWADFRRLEGGSGQEAFSRWSLAVLRLGADGRHTVLEQRALPGVQRLYLYPGSVGFAPLELSLRPGAGSYLEVRGLRVEPWLTGSGIDVSSAAQAVRPLAADPGTILLYDRRAWRQPDYELFAWARFPRILILDTADYQVQDRFFKRLAFFVEKLGYRGRLVSTEEVAALHGFNAHDYRAEDLARFFKAAAASDEPLSAEERQLERMLIANGILRAGSEPGDGAILSISQSSPDTLRRLLLTHEALHGLYFTLPRYRQACSSAWKALDGEGREFWLLFLRWWHYDIDDPFLAANEFQAYLLQQPRPALGYYFRVLSAGRLRSAYPRQAAWLDGFLAARPASFELSYDRLVPVLRLEARLEGGRLVELERRQ